MDMITISKVECHDTHSCNNCYASNYKNSEFNKYTEQLYLLKAGLFNIYLCSDCLKMLADNITELINNKNT